MSNIIVNPKNYTGRELETIFFRPLLTGPSAEELGLTIATGANRKAADKTARHELRQALHTAARSALKRLSEYLDRNASFFEEYDPRQNILKRCTRDGGFIQIH